MRLGRAGWLLLGSSTLAPTAAGAQSVSVAASRWLTDPRVMDYRISVMRYGVGPLAFRPYAQLALQGPASGGASLVGVGGDLTIRVSARARPYLVGGVSGGFLDFDRKLGVGLWGSWSAGLGYELFRVGPVGLGVETRYQMLSRKRTGGVSIGLRLGSPVGRGGDAAGPGPIEPGRSDGGPPPAPAEAPPEAASPDGAPAPNLPAGAARDVVNAALDVMGTPYRWGGTNANGFDCSGLIVYAYAQVGIELPRRSADQARAGRPVIPQVTDLAPGDILAFSATVAGAVSHVGLYLGDGRFVHSASSGVRISRLSMDDPDGRWWYERWIGARRVLGS
jgi:NlpC/P60 family